MDDAEEIDGIFDGIANSPPLLDALYNYLETAKPQLLVRNPHTLLFSQTKGDVLYRGIITVAYVNNAKMKMNNCLFIQNFMISPRGGNLLIPTFAELLNSTNKLSSIYVEAIMSEKVRDRFIENGWKQVGDDNVILIKSSGTGKKKRRTHKRKGHKKSYKNI